MFSNCGPEPPATPWDLFSFRFHEAFFPDEEIYEIGETLKESDCFPEQSPYPSVPAEELPPHPTLHPLPTADATPIHHQPRQNNLTS